MLLRCVRMMVLRCRLKLMVGLLSIPLLCYFTITTIFDPYYFDFLLRGNSHIVRGKRMPNQMCKLPSLEPWSADGLKYYKKLKPLLCGKEDWVYVRNGSLYISQNARLIHGAITCQYWPVVRVDDFKNSFGGPSEKFTDAIRLTADFFRVECISSSKTIYKNIHAAVHLKENIQKRAFKRSGNPLGMNVLVTGFDSVSKMSWLRNMPKTHQYTIDELGAVVFDAFNVVGDGTLGNLLPMLTGRAEAEMLSVRREQTADGFPLIWKNFSRAGYVTQYGEDFHKMYAFVYKHLGFVNEPTDHYLRPFSIESPKYYKGRCIGSRPIHDVNLEWQLQLFKMYTKIPKFSFFFHAMGHDQNSNLQPVDGDVVSFLKSMREGGYLNNTLLILMSDHGARYGDMRNTVHGKFEERLPYLALRFPPWFARKYPEAIKNLKNNAKRLITTYDLYATLCEIMNYTGHHSKNTTTSNPQSPGVSLLKEIPVQRGCEAARIPSHFCSCLQWEVINTTLPNVVKAADSIVQYFNSLLEPVQSLCSPLRLRKILTATQLLPNEKLLAFKKEEDSRKYFGAETTIKELFYQITLLTSPNNGTYEATVRHVLAGNHYEPKENEISRTNKYGNQPHCISKDRPSLKSYCYCINDNL